MVTALLLCASTAEVGAQKAFKPIKEYIKSGKNLDKAAAAVKTLEADSTFTKRAELLNLGFLVQDKMYQTENEKIYLKQKYDTAAFFASIYSMFDYASRCYDAEKVADNKGKIRIKYSYKNRDKLLPIYPNLRTAGIHYYNKSNFAEAARYFTMYIVMGESEFLTTAKTPPSQEYIPQVAYMTMVSYSAIRKYSEALLYTERAMRDSSLRNYALENAANAYNNLDSTLMYEETLTMGVKEYPLNPYFFTSLVDVYVSKKDYNGVVKLSDSLLNIYPEKNVFKFGKSIGLLRLEDYEGCIALSDELIKADSVNAEVYFNAGISYVNMAKRIKPESTMPIQQYRAAKKKSQELYKKALPYMEKYRDLLPDRPNRWALALYNIYFELNMEKEFKQMEKIVSLKIS